MNENKFENPGNKKLEVNPEEELQIDDFKEAPEPNKNVLEANEDSKQKEEIESKKLEEQKELEDDYGQLEQQNSVLEQIEKDQESLVEIRKKLGIPVTDDQVQNSEAFKKVEEIKKKIAGEEIEFLDLPEDVEDGESSVLEDFSGSAEFLKLLEELKKSAEEAMEQFIADTTNDIVQKWSKEFSGAENGEVAEKLFRLKFPVYFRENLKYSDSDVTHTVFHFKTFKNSGGREIFYFEKIDIENVSRGTFLEKTKKPEYDEKEAEKNPNFNKDADPKLVGKKEVEELGDLMDEKKLSL